MKHGFVKTLREPTHLYECNVHLDRYDPWDSRCICAAAAVAVVKVLDLLLTVPSPCRRDPSACVL